MAKRYSGNATVMVQYNDKDNAWKATVAVNGKDVWSGNICAAAFSTRVAVDSPEAYDSVARSALAFATVDPVNYGSFGFSATLPSNGCNDCAPDYETLTVGTCSIDRIVISRRAPRKTKVVA